MGYFRARFDDMVAVKDIKTIDKSAVKRLKKTSFRLTFPVPPLIFEFWKYKRITGRDILDTHLYELSSC